MKVYVSQTNDVIWFHLFSVVICHDMISHYPMQMGKAFLYIKCNSHDTLITNAIILDLVVHGNCQKANMSSPIFKE